MEGRLNSGAALPEQLPGAHKRTRPQGAAGMTGWSGAQGWRDTARLINRCACSKQKARRHDHAVPLPTERQDLPSFKWSSLLSFYSQTRT